MSRKLTTYKRPSVLQMIATTGTIESLAAMRDELRRAYTRGEITASARTMRDWSEAVWVRVLELMALQPENAPYIHSVTLTWQKPPELQLAIEEQMRRVTAALPSPAERLKRAGVCIQGVTS